MKAPSFISSSVRSLRFWGASRLTNLFAVTPSAPSRSLTLVRHGQSTWNQSGLIQGQNDVSVLTQRGREEARAAAEDLRPLHAERLTSSDLRRASETGQIIGGILALEATYDERLRERCFGNLEGEPVAALSPELSGIRDGVLFDPDAKPNGGESFRDVVARVGDFFEETQRSPGSSRLLVVTHGGAIRALRAYVDGSPLEGLAMIDVANCSIWDISLPAAID